MLKVVRGRWHPPWSYLSCMKIARDLDFQKPGAGVGDYQPFKAVADVRATGQVIEKNHYFSLGLECSGKPF